MDTHSPRAHPYAVGRPRELAARRRAHVYVDDVTDQTLSILRRLVPGISDSRLFRLGLDALVDRLGPNDAAALEADLQRRAS
jgi:hypothetical protein